MRFWHVSHCQATNDLANLHKVRSKCRSPAPVHRIHHLGRLFDALAHMCGSRGGTGGPAPFPKRSQKYRAS